MFVIPADKNAHLSFSISCDDKHPSSRAERTSVVEVGVQLLIVGGQHTLLEQLSE